MNKQIDILKEKRDLKILEIIRNVLLFIAFFLGVLIFALESLAAPSGESGSHHNSTSSNDAKLLNYVSESGAENGQLLFGLGNDVLNGVEDAYTSFLYYFVPESALTPAEKEILGYFDNINDGSLNPSVIFNIDDSFNWTIKDEYKTDYDSLINKLCTNINNQYLLYPTKSGDFINNLAYPDFNVNNAKDSLSYYNGDDFPIYFYRFGGQYYSLSLENITNNSDIDCDGFIFRSGDWSFLVDNWDTYVQHGYIPKKNGNELNCAFNIYANGTDYSYPVSNFKYKNDSYNITPNPFYIYTYSYRDYWYSNQPENVTCLIGKSDIPMLFFRDFTAYTTFYNNKMAIPFDFSGLDLPDNFDYTQFFKSIDRNLIDTEHSLDVLYSYLNEELSKQIQEIIDSQRTTNELLLALLRYYDKNIVKDGENITEILLDINESIKNIGSPDEEEVSTFLDTILQDESIENRLKHIFPFGVFQDSKDLLDKFTEIGVLEPRWDFRMNIGLFEEKYVDFTLDLTTIPEINTFKSFWFFFILLSFNILCLCIEYKFLCMFMGGGD